MIYQLPSYRMLLVIQAFIFTVSLRHFAAKIFTPSENGCYLREASKVYCTRATLLLILRLTRVMATSLHLIKRLKKCLA